MLSSEESNLVIISCYLWCAAEKAAGQISIECSNRFQWCAVEKAAGQISIEWRPVYSTGNLSLTLTDVQPVLLD